MPEERAQIGKYALKNTNTQAARHFSKVLGRKIIQNQLQEDWRLSTYEHWLKAKRLRRPGGECLPTKEQGRPLLLDQDLDKAVQEYIEATRAADKVVNTAIVMAAAVSITRTHNQ